MKEINYKFSDGTKQTVKVSDEFYSVYEQMNNEEKSNNRKETRRHISMDYLNENNMQFSAPAINLFDQLIASIDSEKLNNAISKLNPMQQTLLRRVYFFNETMASISRELGISKSAVTQQMKVVLAHLKKILKNF